VILKVEVDQKGVPITVEVEQGSGYQLLDQAALKAVKRWRFQPERIGGVPVKSKVSIPVRFRLEESDKKISYKTVGYKALNIFLFNSSTYIILIIFLNL